MASRKARVIDDGPKALEELVNRALRLCKTARRNNKSLRGDNHYSNKLVELRADATNTFRELTSQSAGDAAALAEMIQTVFGADTENRKRNDAAKELVFSLRTTWRQSTAHDQPASTHSVVPLSLLDQTNRGYLRSIGRQVNGCYVQGFYDASAVMLRRLLEVAIIEAFENKGLAQQITNSDGDYLHLSELVSAALQETSWRLSRNTKKYAPKLRDLGHQSAHGRYFHATKDDIDRVRDESRIVIEEFLRLAGLI